MGVYVNNGRFVTTINTIVITTRVTFRQHNAASLSIIKKVKNISKKHLTHLLLGATFDIGVVLNS